MKSSRQCGKSGKLLRRRYRILDVAFGLESDSEDFMETFHRDYCWFELHEKMGETPLYFSAFFDDEIPRVCSDSRTLVLAGNPNMKKCAYQMILKWIFEKVQSYLLVHAGVVAENGRVLALSGAPGFGKTTLVIELLKRGFTLFSDDYCPIEKSTGRVHPFPRSVWVAADRIGDIQPISDFTGRSKIPLRADDMQWPVGDFPNHLSTLICLDDDELVDRDCLLKLELKEGGEALVQEVERLDNVKISKKKGEFPYWEIRYPKGRKLTLIIKKMLETHSDNIWHVYREHSVKPDFNRTPTLVRISVHDAAFRVMKEFKNKLIFEEKSELTPMNYMIELCRVLDKTVCYRMTPGKLDRMIGMILDILKTDAEVEYVR